ncbi:transcription elongation factor A N-terminal and central domain-containing protein [Myotis daubentonii]|uniref:transcription elongation factor A N-terminal and central domain-containing protein n=1 Tax=Myotis daubentonii TaxID=98922 RepID=UPI002873C866|nr:transcription elongation factor A N-terminal and central domain-containing protein [Myotis daubentonii]XP_059534563.1 transcription elongation factor A N-terminal and central domain-containing protein [Myotis daubentonii]XP_059534564.1 transcription elongation factor A N-terminal and central domain-containing protein [Myotis daubentonii]XP_059534565.1 transcription elongation factor A N-terminal and central domain-containing protein [Myotis daubentonii]XP_059534566.1 transcription elongation
MSARTQLAARASRIEQLLSEGKFEDLGNHLTELETLHVTKEHLQQTHVVRAVYRVLKNCPTVALKKKSKCLLSKWKALYNDPYFKPGDSPKFFPVGDKDKNSGLSYDSRPDETLRGSSSDPLLSSQDAIAKAAEMLMPENSPNGMERKEEDVKGGDPKSTDKRSSELPHPAVPVRMKCTELLYEALTSSSTNQPKAELWQSFAREIEEHVFTLYSKNLKKYKTCIRSKVANLKNPRNSHLQRNLLSGTMSPREFAEMTVMDMASKELKELRDSYTESGIQEHCLPQVMEGTQTEKIKCRHCEKFNCKVTVIDRGALFLPSWVRNSNPDEQMMTYVICNECGQQWYHSNWVCL